MKKFIAIEGIDGVGKSTTAKGLAKKLGYNYVKTPTRDFLKCRYLVDRPGTKPKDRFTFYACGLEASSKEIDNYLLEGTGVVVDRYAHSLQFYHEILDPLTDYACAIQDYTFREPDAHIVLNCDTDVLEARILNRAQRTDSTLETNFDFLNKVSKKFTALEGVLHLNTAQYNKKEVLEKCLNYIK